MKTVYLALSALGLVVIAGCAGQDAVAPNQTIDNSPTSQTGNVPGEPTPSTTSP